MNRIAIIGSGGAGKTTLAQALSTRLALPHTELDHLYWRPGWQAAPPDEFRACVDAVTAAPRWIICGNQSKVQPAIFARADTVVWLDYPLWLTWWRLLRRTFQRVVTRSELWGSGNHETWRGAFLSRDSLLLYVLRTHHRRSARYQRLVTSNAYPNATWLRFRSPQATETWLKALERQSPTLTNTSLSGFLRIAGTCASAAG